MPVMEKVKTFFEGGVRSFMLIWIVMGTAGDRRDVTASEGARLRPSDVRGRELTEDSVTEGVKEVGEPSNE